MKRIERTAPDAVVQVLRAAGRALVLGASLALVACGGGGGGSSDVVTPPVTPPAVVAPSIGAQPQDAKVIDGATTTFNVSATGASLTYQWQRDGKSIVGATGASYTTPVLRMTDNGAHFQVVVAGPNTSVTSASVTLTVTPIAISFTAQPQAQTAKDGEVVSFEVDATGSEPIQYQWQRDGVAITGADKAAYTTSALALGDNAAVFKVVVTNPAGMVSSQEAKLTVMAVAPRIVTAPESVTTVDGSTVTFKVTAAGSAPLSYQWLRNGSPISGATGATYLVTLAYGGSGDRYAVQVSNTAGQVVSTAAVATINAAAVAIGQPPADTTIATGGTASFSVAASGTAPLKYQWQQSQDEGLTWTAILGATSSSYVISNATLADSSTRMRVVVSNPSSTLNSAAGLLTVQPNIRILAGGAGGSGYADGKGAAARFFYASGMSSDASGNIYIIDTNTSHVVRRVSPDGTVKLFAGQPGMSGRVNGPALEARFIYPRDVLVDGTGAVVVAESCSLRRIAQGVVTPFIGDGICATRDGTGTQAAVNQVMGMALDPDGNIFISEWTAASGQVIRKITPAGVISTVAGSLTETGNADGAGNGARFTSVGKLAADANKNIYAVDGAVIRRITPAGDVMLYAGSTDIYGLSEGYRTAVRFNYISGLAFDSRGNLFLSDSVRIARISPIGNVVTAVSGAYKFGNWTSDDGPAASATAGNPLSLTTLPDGAVGFFDSSSYAVRTISAAAVVRTLAGSGRTGGFADGIGPAAQFGNFASTQNAAVMSPLGDVIVAEASNRRIRRLQVRTGAVDTIAGGEGLEVQDGPVAVARFLAPSGLAYDPAGNLYVADSTAIRRIGVNGDVRTVAGSLTVYGSADGVGTSARFSGLGQMVMDSRGNLIVADASNYVLRRIAPDGTVTTVAGKAGSSGYVNGPGSEARLGYLRALVIDAADNVYFTDGTHAIRKLTPAGEVVPVAGAPYSANNIDDIGAFARFSGPMGLAFDALGNLYVADTGNNAIRRITPGGQVATVVAGGPFAILQVGLAGTINQPRLIVVTPGGRLVFSSELAMIGD